MKIAVFSDSHKSGWEMKQAIHRTSPQLILHLGDHERDLSPFMASFPQIPYIGVRGNCDPGAKLPTMHRFTCEGKQIFMSHGHLHHVKSGTTALLSAALAAGDDIVLFGHTHRACQFTHQGMCVLNPGSVGMGFEKSFGLIEIDSQGLSARVLKIEENF